LSADLSVAQQEKLKRLAQRLINQKQARILIPPNKAASGFWFGGGNLAQDEQGQMYLVGRYRNFGDSRTGLEAGTRGLELAIFKVSPPEMTAEKIFSLSKADLSVGGSQVLSIEGAALQFHQNGVQLYISSEKANVHYPPEVQEFQKPGTGVWTIDLVEGATIEELSPQNLKPFLQCKDPRYLHVKDPFLNEADSGDQIVLFCSHPYNWSSSNTGYTIKRKNEDHYDPPVYDFFPRGTTWDVAMSRATSAVPLPATGSFAQGPSVTLLFYDGGECVRQLEEHGQAVIRPRGYSCEEIGGLAYFLDNDLHHITRLSSLFPLFTSPWGTGSSRYVDVLAAADGFYATWEQSQKDRSQALVTNFVSREEITEILT
jgi:hypothetical protein